MLATTLPHLRHHRAPGREALEAVRRIMVQS